MSNHKRIAKALDELEEIVGHYSYRLNTYKVVKEDTETLEVLEEFIRTVQESY